MSRVVLVIPFCLKSTNATFWAFRIKSNVSVVSAGLHDLARLLCQPHGGPLSLALLHPHCPSLCSSVGDFEEQPQGQGLSVDGRNERYNLS